MVLAEVVPGGAVDADVLGDEVVEDIGEEVWCAPAVVVGPGGLELEEGVYFYGRDVMPGKTVSRCLRLRL